jgi:ATP-binding cassette subfamily C protein PrsD
LKTCRSAFVAVGIASAFVNLLYLTGSFFMLEVYDRVLPSQSIPTLIGLSGLALLLFGFQGAFEIVRGRMLVRIAGALDEAMETRLYRAVVKAPLTLKAQGDGLQPVRDFDQVRSFLSSAGPAAFFDMPWLPFYVGICFLFHPVIGIVAIIGTLILVGLTLLTHSHTRGPSRLVSESGNHRNGFVQASQRNAEVIEAMGMTGRMADIWRQHNGLLRDSNRCTADVGNGYSAVSKVFRMVLQSAVLATGAVLVIEGQATAGIIIAGSILTARALAPVELAIGHWRGFAAARQSWQRLTLLIQALPQANPKLELPVPTLRLDVDALSSGPPGVQRSTLLDIAFSVPAGSALGVIGPSASGKSTLARALLGVWPVHRGAVRLDGAAIEQWDSDRLGRHIGYLPQTVELFAGTIAQNIGRFAKDAAADTIVAAARAAGVHEMVVKLEHGYDTVIDEAGNALSAGQRQRVALARALYGDPFLVVLDEPNSNLDAEGEQALSAAISGVRKRRGIVVVIAHRPSALASADLVLVLNAGRMQAFGPKEQVLARMLQQDGPRPKAGVAAQAPVTIIGRPDHD